MAKLWNPDIAGLCVQGVPCERGADGAFEVPDELVTTDLVESLKLSAEPPSVVEEPAPKRRR